MKHENDYDYLKDFFDLIPDPLAIVNKRTFEIYYVNQEFQYFVKKSFSVIKNTYLNELLNDDLFFLSNLNEISKKPGIYFIREAIIRKNIKFSVICIVTERKNKNMMIIVKKETEEFINDSSDDSGAYEHFFSIFVHFYQKTRQHSGSPPAGTYNTNSNRWVATSSLRPSPFSRRAPWRPAP